METVQTMEHKPYKATKAFHPVTGAYRWGVWCDTAKFMTWPNTYGLRSARKMTNRLNRKYKKRMAIVAMARNSCTIGV